MLSRKDLRRSCVFFLRPAGSWRLKPPHIRFAEQVDAPDPGGWQQAVVAIALDLTDAAPQQSRRPRDRDQAREAIPEAEPARTRLRKRRLMRLSHRDQLTLREMLADACEWVIERSSTGYAAETVLRYEKTLAKIVPKGSLKGCSTAASTPALPARRQQSICPTWRRTLCTPAAPPRRLGRRRPR